MTISIGYREDMEFWMHDWQWLLLPETDAPGREAIITEGEKMADKMAKDIASGPMSRNDRTVVRKALDTKDAPPSGRAATDTAIQNINRRG